YTPAGDLVRLIGGARDVSVLHNTLWTEDGYGLFVANDSQAGFFSDFNNLYASGNGKVGYWTRDFVDVLDWQADIARFDLNSVGATVVNPEWARPRFESRYNDAYALNPLFGSQRFTSPLALPAAGQQHIALQSPDLYVDAVRDRALAIRWESFNNTGGSDVRIDLYRDTPDGPAFLTTITAATPDDGEFLWTPAADAIPYGTYGLRVQVSWVDNPLVLDRSQEPFTVPEDGDVYFVDDASNANDEYTPNGIGDNRHTGKISSAPKPYPTNLLRVYDLTPGSRLLVDTGDYPLIDPVTVSGVTDLGLGTEEGFELSGPTGAGRVAALFPAIPGDQSRPLIEINDADDMLVSHLTLRDAAAGLLVHNGSDDFLAHDIVATGHAGNGIDITSVAPLSKFTGLEARENAGSGIVINGPIASLSDSIAAENAGDGVRLAGGVDEVWRNIAVLNRGTGFVIQAPGDAVIQNNVALANERGLVVENAGGGSALVGSKSLAPLTANIIWQNTSSGAEVSGDVVFAGNTVAEQTAFSAIGITARDGAVAMSNIVYGSGIGIDAAQSLVQGNRVYANRQVGILAVDSDVLENVVYTNPLGVSVAGNTVLVRNNVIYDNERTGLLVTGANDAEVVNNTLVEIDADALRIEGGASGTNVRNNIIWAEHGTGITVTLDSQAGFTSDTNVLYRSPFGSGDTGFWNGAARSSFADWRGATGTDVDSLFTNPLFVDANGADNILGYQDGVTDGRDDDFHVRSEHGSFHGGSLAPVQGPPSFIYPGTPVALTPILTLDAQQSPAIDRGDANDPFADEPVTNGGYVNVGAYGNTAQASLSPAQYVMVLAPNGGERIHQLSTFDIRWRSDGLAGPVDIAYSATGIAGSYALLAANETNDGVFEWTVDETVIAAGSNYFIRVSDVADASINDTSDFAFEIVNDPPVIGTLPDVVLNEGDAYSVRLDATDPEGGTLTAVVSGVPGATAVRDGDEFVIAWASTPDGPDTGTVTVTVTDSGLPARSVATSFELEVLNVAPTLMLSGDATTTQEATYTLGLAATDPGDDTITSWTIDWGDGTVEVVAGNPPVIDHVYSLTGSFEINASATDEDGTWNAAPFALEVNALDPLAVVSVTPNASGFDLRFNRAIDASVLNLYDGAGGTFGLPDLVLAGPAGDVQGSLLLDADLAGFSFVRTGGPLADGAYTLTLASRADGFRGEFGSLLDGDDDGVAGGDFLGAFNVALAGSARIGIADFARGPEQAVDLPGDVSGTPVTIADAGLFTTATFELHYDSTLLTITDVVDPAGGTATVDLSVAGIARITVEFGAPVDGTALELTRILGSVPGTAPYGAKQRLDIMNIAIDGVDVNAVGAHGVQVVSYVGDATFSATYTLQDVQQIQAVLVGLAAGFEQWPLVDPVIIGDTSANGRLTGADATLLLREISGSDQPKIPPLPVVPPVLPLSGPDPLVSLPATTEVANGRDVTVPIELDTAAGLEAAQLEIAYDPSVIELRDVRRGSVTGDFEWLTDTGTPGVIKVDLARIDALPGGRGSLVDLDFRVKDAVRPGRYLVDLVWASLNDGRLTLNPVPMAGEDHTDGWLRVRGEGASSGHDANGGKAAAKGGQRIAWPDTSGPRTTPTSRATASIDAWVEDFLTNAGRRQMHPNNAFKIDLPLELRTSGSGTGERSSHLNSTSSR
ncbi:MAG: right-handed parallel beta-helix repeat-containing protein, partial [Gammaproteobacteria bacterium]